MPDLSPAELCRRPSGAAARRPELRISPPGDEQLRQWRAEQQRRHGQDNAGALACPTRRDGEIYFGPLTSKLGCAWDGLSSPGPAKPIARSGLDDGFRGALQPVSLDLNRSARHARDPRIHPFRKKMDRRVKPGDDDRMIPT